MSTSAIKKKSEPKLIFVFVSALALASCGFLFGVVYLMSFPLTAYSSLKERTTELEERESGDPLPGDAYYIEGPILRTLSWVNKRQQLIEGTASSIRVTPGEVNAWFESKFRSTPPANNEDEPQGFSLAPDTPNLAVDEEGTIYLNLPATLTGYGLDGDYVLSARVHYSSGSPASLVVDHLQVGGAAIPLPKIVGGEFVSTVIKGFRTAEEYGEFSEAWKRVKSVETNEGALVLTLDTP